MTGSFGGRNSLFHQRPDARIRSIGIRSVRSMETREFEGRSDIQPNLQHEVLFRQPDLGQADDENGDGLHSIRSNNRFGLHKGGSAARFANARLRDFLARRPRGRRRLFQPPLRPGRRDDKGNWSCAPLQGVIGLITGTFVLPGRRGETISCRGRRLRGLQSM